MINEKTDILIGSTPLHSDRQTSRREHRSASWRNLLPHLSLRPDASFFHEPG